jgi:hypothetical protein
LIRDLIKGHQKLEEYFGYMPNFHDFEVVNVELDRSGPGITLVINGFDTTVGVEDGMYVQCKHCQITLSVTKVMDMKISGFNHQNVIEGLIVENVDDGVKVRIQSSFGLEGYVIGKSIEVQSVTEM